MSCNKLHVYTSDFHSSYSITILTIFDMAAEVSATKENRNLDDMATCRICLKYFADPRLLPCSHTYCFGCIRKAASGTNGDFMCPLKDGTTIQRNEINSLRLHPAMAEVVKMASQMITKDDPPQENSKH